MTSEVNLESVNNNVYLNSDTVSEKLNHCGECHANSSFGGSSNIMGSSADRDTASLDSGCDSSCTSGKSCSLELGEQFHAQDNAVDRIPRRRKIMNVDGFRDGEGTELKREEELVRRRSSSVLEVKEHAHARLREELLKAEEELKLKDEECKKLARVHDQMSEELEELTAKLFEEANKMVQDANIKRMNSEKLLAEANTKIEVLQAEVTALKTLVITSTPSMPNKHLHPQLANSGDEGRPQEFVKCHRRSTSHHNFTKEMKSWEPSAQTAFDPRKQDTCIREVDPVTFEEFQKWKRQPSLKKSAVFMSRIMEEDIGPCLTFTNSELSERVLKCVFNNTLTIEPVHERNPFPRRCALTQASRLCKYRIKFEDSEPFYYVSLLARNRIAAVCDFITYVRYITQGLVKCDESTMYWEIMHLRKQISTARLGFS